MLVGKWKCKVGKVGSRLGLARPALTFVVFDFFPTSYLPTYKVLFSTSVFQEEQYRHNL